MESIALAIYLFAVVFMVFCWLITPVQGGQSVIVTTDMSEIKTLITEEITTEELAVKEPINGLKTEELITESPLAVPEPATEQSEKDYSQKEDPIAQEPNEKVPMIDLKAFRTYLLHKNRCIKLKDLPEHFEIPQDIKTYNLRGEKVVRVSSVEALLAI